MKTQTRNAIRKNRSEARTSSALRRALELAKMEFRCIFSGGHAGSHIFIAVPKGHMQLSCDCLSKPKGERLQELNAEFCDSLCKSCFQTDCDCNADAGDRTV